MKLERDRIMFKPYLFYLPKQGDTFSCYIQIALCVWLQAQITYILKHKLECVNTTFNLNTKSRHKTNLIYGSLLNITKRTDLHWLIFSKHWLLMSPSPTNCCIINVDGTLYIGEWVLTKNKSSCLQKMQLLHVMLSFVGFHIVFRASDKMPFIHCAREDLD